MAKKRTQTETRRTTNNESRRQNPTGFESDDDGDGDGVILEIELERPARIRRLSEREQRERAQECQHSTCARSSHVERVHTSVGTVTLCRSHRKEFFGVSS